jgi:ABC-type glycerol-3-phosphate transport system substrate-binding protein
MNKFQLGVLIVFILFAAIGVFFFATFKGSQDVRNIKVNIWGTEDIALWNKFLADFNNNTERAFSVDYKKVDSDNFIDDVVNSIASGSGPDIIVLSSKDLINFEDKILPIPYESLSERTFKDTFIEGSEIFLTKGGILGLPLSVDPLVMYWNRDIFQSNGLSNPPSSWSEFFPLSERITEKDNALNVTRSAVAMGEYENINNAKEIIFSLILQNNNKVIKRNSETGFLQVVLSENPGLPVSPAESALKFYTEFSNPSKTSYSWNRALPKSIDFFSSGDLALYFGLTSEYQKIKTKNPNLNFDVALFPQGSDARNKKVYGEIESLVILKSSKNPTVAVSVVSALVAEENIKSWVAVSGLPPVRRSLLSKTPGTAFEDLFYKSALIAEPFVDPNNSKSSVIFENMIESIVSGRERISQALRRATTDLNALIVEK